MDIRILLQRILHHCDEIAADIKSYSRSSFETDGKEPAEYEKDREA